MNLKIIILISIFINSQAFDRITSKILPELSVYGEVPGLEPSPFYKFNVRKEGSKEWFDTFAFVTECTLEKYCNTTGYYGALGQWFFICCFWRVIVMIG